MSDLSLPAPAYPNQPHLAVVALLYLLSRPHAAGNRAIAAAIVAHFRFVADDPRQTDELRAAARQLGRVWAGLLEAADHPGEPH